MGGGVAHEVWLRWMDVAFFFSPRMIIDLKFMKDATQ